MTAAQNEVLKVIEDFGPLTDAALVPLVQHVANIRISSSGVRSRRSELVDAGLVSQNGEVKMPSGRMAAKWQA